MTPERKAQIDVWSGIAEDFSDGAWFGFMMVENGVTDDELAEWSEINAAMLAQEAEDET